MEVGAKGLVLIVEGGVEWERAEFLSSCFFVESFICVI